MIFTNCGYNIMQVDKILTNSADIFICISLNISFNMLTCSYQGYKNLERYNNNDLNMTNVNLFVA